MQYFKVTFFEKNLKLNVYSFKINTGLEGIMESCN